MLWILTVWFVVLANGAEETRSFDIYYLSQADCIAGGFGWKRDLPSVEKFRCKTGRPAKLEL